MCGRFRVARKKEILEEAFDADDSLSPVDWAPGYVPRYNVAPGQEIAVVRQDVRQDATRPARRLSPMLWGLIPSWAKGPAEGYKMINLRSETVAARPAFRELLRARRCLIPADGFYEWKREGKQKLPFCFAMADDALFAFAGLWERWRNPLGQTVESCSILTTSPNPLVQEVHDRMPVILAREDYERWLDPDFTRVAELQPLLKPFPAEAMRCYRVSQRVNQVANDDPECAAEIAAA